MSRWMRSIRYWGMNMEKLFLGMMCGIILGSVLAGMDKEGFREMLSVYLSMFGGIFGMLLMMSAVTHYIPQSLGMGATRKDTFMGLEFVLHLAFFQSMLVIIFLNCILSKALCDMKTLQIVLVFYLLSAGFSNLICVLGLTFGNTVTMISYVIMALVVAGFSVFLGIVADDTGNVFPNLLQMLKKGWFAALAFDVVMGVVCYIRMYKYEIRA